MSIILNIMKDAKRVGITLQYAVHEETNTPAIMLKDDNGYILFIKYRTNPTWTDTPLSMDLVIPGHPELIVDINMGDLVTTLISLDEGHLSLFAMMHDMKDLLDTLVEEA